MYQNRNKTNVKNSEIGHDSESLTSNTQEPVELSQLDCLSSRVPVKGVGKKPPTQTGV